MGVWIKKMVFPVVTIPLKLFLATFKLRHFDVVEFCLLRARIYSDQHPGVVNSKRGVFSAKIRRNRESITRNQSHPVECNKYTLRRVSASG